MAYTDSILLTIKKMLGISADYHAFDLDILTDINAVFLSLNQLGVGPVMPFQLPIVLDEDEDGPETLTWADFLGDHLDYIPAVQTYIYQRVRLIFDPPANSFTINAIQESCKELEWRFTVQPKTQGEVQHVECHKLDYSAFEEPEPDFGLDVPDTPEPPDTTDPDGGEDGDGGDEGEGGEDKDKDLFEIFG